LSVADIGSSSVLNDKYVLCTNQVNIVRLKETAAFINELEQLISVCCVS